MGWGFITTGEQLKKRIAEKKEIMFFLAQLNILLARCLSQVFIVQSWRTTPLAPTPYESISTPAPTYTRSDTQQEQEQRTTPVFSTRTDLLPQPSETRARDVPLICGSCLGKLKGGHKKKLLFQDFMCNFLV